jgi:hypothetical protein
LSNSQTRSQFATGNVVAPTTTLAFLAPTASVTIQAGDIIYVSSSIALGTTTTTGASNLTLTIAYSSGGAPVSVGGGMAGISIGRNGRPIHALSALITGLAAGTYSVGMAGSSTATDWNSLGRGYTTVLVIRP